MENIEGIMLNIRIEKGGLKPSQTPIPLIIIIVTVFTFMEENDNYVIN